MFRKKEKNCILKQHYINIGAFGTQLEAYRLAEEIRKHFNLSDNEIEISVRYLEVSQSEYEKLLDKAQEAMSKSP